MVLDAFVFPSTFREDLLLFLTGGGAGLLYWTCGELASAAATGWGTELNT